MTKLKLLVLMLAHFFKFKIFLSAILINLFLSMEIFLMLKKMKKKQKSKCGKE